MKNNNNYLLPSKLKEGTFRQRLDEIIELTKINNEVNGEGHAIIEEGYIYEIITEKIDLRVMYDLPGGAVKTWEDAIEFIYDVDSKKHYAALLNSNGKIAVLFNYSLKDPE